MESADNKNTFRVQLLGEFLLRYGLVVVLGWIGAMKFTAYEAAGIKPLIDTSPLMSWMYKVLSLQATSNVILKDVVLLGAALWTLGDSVTAAKR
jgi:uncharacterized membrane protein YkgB